MQAGEARKRHWMGLQEWVAAKKRTHQRFACLFALLAPRLLILDGSQAFKSPLSASTSSTARMPPLSRLTSSERVPSQNPSDLPPPSTLHRPLSTLTSSAVTPGFPGRERLGASMGHAGAGAIGLSESSKRFRSAFRLTKRAFFSFSSCLVTDGLEM